MEMITAMKCLQIQILPTGTIRNGESTVRRKCLLMSGLKWFKRPDSRREYLVWNRISISSTRTLLQSYILRVLLSASLISTFLQKKDSQN